MGSIKIFLSRKNRKGKSHHMLNKNSIKTILNVKHTCIDKVTMLADTSIMIEVHATKLTPNQQAKVEWIAKTDPRLYRAYKLKESLRLVFYNDTVEDAKESLDAWFKWARHCRISAFVELQKKINRHKQSILNTIEYGLPLHHNYGSGIPNLISGKILMPSKSIQLTSGSHKYAQFLRC